MSDSTTDFARMLDPRPGDKFELDHGVIRINRVKPAEVEFTAIPRPFDLETSRVDIHCWPLAQWRDAVHRYKTRNDPPTMTCPKCKAELPDFDGVGVLAHAKPAYPDGCGYCSHPSRDLVDGRWRCGICGERTPDPDDTVVVDVGTA